MFSCDWSSDVCSSDLKKNPHYCSKRVGDVDPGGVANLNGLWDWVGMAPCMGPVSPVRAYFLWEGLCPEKLVKLKLKLSGDPDNLQPFKSCLQGCYQDHLNSLIECCVTQG